ncbi:MAG: pyrroloquinoline-quinone synthase [Thermoanaerobaculia bacterium]|jgi:pyrroloquinoline-quinone synthase|nr:pyrroloquinoline-quinone synthase [Thermoanaerobaculia bacterium]
MTINADIDARIAQQRLLDHPFYQRWTAGELTREELQDYARNYYHYALAFPTFLSAMHAQTEDIETRQLLLENLIEEERGPENHPELWLRFCESLDMDRDEVKRGTPNDATRVLIAALRGSARDGDLHEGLAALYAYESQIPGVAKAKIAGLAEWYGIDAARDIAFFSVHQEADVVHSATSRELLARLCDTETKRGEATAAAGRTLDALYGFLDSVTAATVH